MLPGNHSYDYLRAMERLVTVIQDLSLARDLETITTIVRGAARELTGADGATFVLREGEFCHYVDEDAIAPLWKGSRFPIDACVSGWSMKTREPAIIEDIYADARVPATAYRPTFVKSMVMVPIREAAPIGAIGNYWAVTHRANEGEVRILQALANSTSIAMENVQLYTELERRVRERTDQLEQANHELENLLGNAWKFTRGSAAVVEFRASEQDGETVYSVRDNGVGFDAAHANEVFEPFRRLHSADAFPGTGIGLATVQRIIRRHGGRIWADAAPGHGATFSFTLGPSMSRTRPTDPLPG